MTFYLISLAVLSVAAGIMGVWAVFIAVVPSDKLLQKRANCCGAVASALACLVGFLGVLCQSWSLTAAPQSMTMSWGLPFGQFSLELDLLSRIFLLPIFGLGFVCAASGYMALRHERTDVHNLASHWFFYILLVFGMAVVVCAQDIILFLLAWEIMSLSPFFLVDFNDQESSVRDAAWIYLVAAHLGAVCLLGYFGLLWQCTGSTSLSVSVIGPALKTASPLLLNAMFILALLGFGAKAGIAPLHVWLPDAHPAAPSHISALLSGAMINVGLFGVIRAISQIAVHPDLGFLGAFPTWWSWLILLVGLLTACLGIIKALGQRNLKRLLAYSSVENMGLMFAGLGAALVGISYGISWIALLGFAACLLHMLNHAGFKGLLFLCAGEVLHATGTIRMDLLGGLQKKMPRLGILFAIGAASIACLPPFSGFIGEFLLALSLIDGANLPGVERQLGLLFSLGVIALVSGLACALYVKVYGMTFLGFPRSAFAENVHSPDPQTLWPLLIPAAACILGGIGAEAFFYIASNAALKCGALFHPMLHISITVQDSVLQNLGYVSQFCWGAIILSVTLIACRYYLLQQRDPVVKTTWGCGYQAANVSMQYTQASFSQPLARIFAPIMGLNVMQPQSRQIFPDAAQFAVKAPDKIKLNIYAPLFSGLEQLANMCKIIQHGKIHLYILYILATLVGILLWGLWS